MKYQVPGELQNTLQKHYPLYEDLLYKQSLSGELHDVMVVETAIEADYL